MKRRDEVLVGLFVTVGVIAAILGTLWPARGGLSSGYPLYAKFPWGEGLKQGQPVFLVGVNVGYVANVDLREQGDLVVELRINNDYRVPEGTTATIQAVGVFGDRAIALKPVGPNPASIPAGDTVPTGRPEPGINDIIARLDTVTQSVTKVTDAIELQLVDGGGIQDLRRTLAGTNALVAQLGSIAAEQSRQLSLTMTSLRKATSAVDSVAVDSTVRSLQETSRNMAQLTGDLRQTTAQLNVVLGRLADTTGTAGKLLNDPKLYDDVTRLVTRIDSLTADFKRNPRRYINLEIF